MQSSCSVLKRGNPVVCHFLLILLVVSGLSVCVLKIQDALYTNIYQLEIVYDSSDIFNPAFLFCLLLAWISKLPKIKVRILVMYVMLDLFPAFVCVFIVDLVV